MYMTVTPNSAVDEVIFIEEFLPETVMRTNRQTLSVGGKGFDTSVALRSLGAETLATGFVAGTAGQLLQSLLEKYGIQHDLIWVEGETRTAYVILETSLNRMSHIMVGEMAITPQHCDDFMDRVRHHVSKAKWLVCGGSLPKDVPANLFQQVIVIAQEQKVPSLIDGSGLPLLEAIKIRPNIVKMNRHEFYSTFDWKKSDFDTLIDHAKRQYELLECDALVITCGSDGVLAITSHGHYHAIAPRQRIVNAAGAGDATSAALVWRLSQGEPWETVLRWAAATGAATVLTEGTAESQMADILRILPDVQVQKR